MPDITFGAVSLQLKVMLEAGLVECRGRPSVPRIPVRREALTPVAPMLEQMWTDALWRLKLKPNWRETRRGPRRPRRGRHRAAHDRKRRTDDRRSRTSAGSHSGYPRASRHRVQVFSDSTQWAAWWGAGSSIDPRQGGRMLIRHPNGVEASGEVLEVRAPESIVFTYGYENGKPNPPGSSRVTIRLDSHPQGTLLQLTHEFADGDARGAHPGLALSSCPCLPTSLLIGPATGATALVDQWFAAWGEPDAGVRERSLASITTPEIRFEDQFTCLEGAQRDQRPPERGAKLHAGHATRASRSDPALSVARAGRLGCRGSDGQERGAERTCSCSM